MVFDSGKVALELSWIDEFVRNIKPYIYVRISDRVLIKMPNQAFKLNESGCKILQYLLDGHSIREFVENAIDTEEKMNQIQIFFHGLKKMLSGSLSDDSGCCALDRVEFKLGYIELPVLSEVALTGKCNIRCRFCYATCVYSETSTIRPEYSKIIESGDDQHQMSTDQVQKILYKIRYEAEVPSVSFTGGEPVLRKDLPDLIRYASEKLKMRVNLITNGTLITEDLADKFKRSGLASAQVSIESPDPDVHDEITRTPGSHSASVRGLLALNTSGIHAHPHSTICQLNAQSMLQMAEFVKKLGFKRFSANLMIPAGRGSEETALVMPYDRIGQIIPMILSSANAIGIRFMWYSPTPVCLFNPIPSGLGNKGCSACEGLLSIDYRGRVIPCSSWNEPIGSLLEESFPSIWHSTRACHIRKKREAFPACHECNWFHLCHGACPLYFHQMGYHEIQPFTRQLEICS